MARPLTERKNIDLETQIEPAMPDMFQDQGKVQQILNNLLSNAIKFTPEGGRIVVSAGAATEATCCSRWPTPAWASPRKTRSRSSRNSARGKSVLTGGDAMTREYSGTGLGLSIVKELCKLLGGEISLESELGKGSTFTVRLPWTRADQPKLDNTLATGNLEDLKPRREPPRLVEAPAATS